MNYNPLSSVPGLQADQGVVAHAIQEFGGKLGGLSRRERSVLDLAAQGRTDEQIAQALGVTRPTVNSYWMRIRGKLGFMSRTEMSALLLRHEASLEHDRLLQQNLMLSELVEQGRRETEALRARHEGLQEAFLSLGLLGKGAEATLLVRSPSHVVVANRQALSLYGAAAGELEGRPMRELSTDDTPEKNRDPCRHLRDEDGPEREVVGLDSPYFARRVDGSSFRAVLHVVRVVAASSPLAVVTVRPYPAVEVRLN